MKKKLKSELVNIAHRILRMDSDSDYADLQLHAKKLYETLTVLVFAETHFNEPGPTIGKKAILEVIEAKEFEAVEISAEKEPKEEQIEVVPVNMAIRVETNAQKAAAIAKANDEIFHKMQAEKAEARKSQRDKYRPDGSQQNKSQDNLHEPVIEKIKDLVAQMPPEADEIDDMFQRITGSEPVKNDVADIGEYSQEAVFEKKEIKINKPKSINDSASQGWKIGLNTRIGFIKHLFEGSDADYNRVISQLSTMSNRDEAIGFIQNQVKPDYNWEGKELYETRLLDIIERKFEK